VSLPVYFAADLNRLPPVDTNHCDVSAILAELQYLRAEVRDAARLAEEVTMLRQEIAQIHQLKSTVDEVCHDMVKLRDDQKNFPPLPSRYCSSAQSVIADGQAAAEVASNSNTVIPKKFTDQVRELRETGIRRQQPRKTRPAVIGSSTSNNCVKAVTTSRVVDVFISRLHPQTTMTEVKECVTTINNDKLQIHEIVCDKLQVRYEHLYASFRVQIRVNSSDMKGAIDLFMSNESWPYGTFVRRYFKPKQQHDGL